MTFSPATPESLQVAQDALKRRNGHQRLITNYFFSPLAAMANLRLIESEKSLCFLHDEWDFSRLFFSTFDLAELELLLQTVSWPPIVVTDWISKEAALPVDRLLTALGFHHHATYDRINCRGFRSERPGLQTCLAAPADCDSIHSLLFRVFDKYTDHIMPADELAGMISQQQVILRRDEQLAIDGLVVFPIKDRTTNFNFLYNKGGPAALVHLLQSFYGTLNERDIQAGFSWVRRTRPLVLKLHQSFGWKTDGLVDYIYMR